MKQTIYIWKKVLTFFILLNYSSCTTSGGKISNSVLKANETKTYMFENDISREQDYGIPIELQLIESDMHKVLDDVSPKTIKENTKLDFKKREILNDVSKINQDVLVELMSGNTISYLPPTIPPDLCGKCPPPENLDVCKCVNNGELYAGTITVTCSENLTSLDHLRVIIHDANFISKRISVFNVLNNDKITGALTNNVWGDLQIEKLFMEGNKLTFIDNKAFVNFRDSLTVLSFRNNTISHFYFPSIDDVPLLVNLVLQKNSLAFIPTDSWHHSALLHLDISENLIESIGARAFQGLPKLASLNLSYNRLTALQDYSLTTKLVNQQTTTIIDLSYNNISYISPLAFTNTTKMQLILTGNMLTTLSEAVFWPIISASDYYVHFVVDENLIICDCNLEWVVAEEEKARLFSNFKCVDKDKNFYELKVHDLGNCHGIHTYDDS